MAATKTATFNEVSSTVVPGLVIGQIWRQLLGSYTGIHTRVPGRTGAWYTPSKRGTRTMRWHCFVMVDEVDAEARRDAVTAVADWLDVDQEVKITISDMPGKFYMGTLGDPGDTEEWREVGEFDLEFIIQPYAFDESISTELWTSDSDDDHTFSPGISAPVWPVIHITPTDGTLLGFTLNTNGDTLAFEGNVLSGTTVTINGIIPIVVSGVGTDTDLTGAFNPNQVILSGVSGTFPTLMPDIVNSIHFIKTSGTATSFSISVEYRKTYRD